jgi:acetoin utilization protein AcuC
MTDGRDASYPDWHRGYDPGAWLDRSIAATRRAVFPFNGLHVDD